MRKRVPNSVEAVRRAIAQSLDVPVGAFPVLGEFFRPLDALGSVPRRMVHWLRIAGISARSRVLDLGCGKGAVSVALACSLRCRALGIDAFDGFVESCKQLAERAGVSDRCEFRTGLIADIARCRDRYDAVLLLNVLPFERAIPIARRLTKPGGVYLIDDAVRTHRAATDSVFPSVEEVTSAIEKAGDLVERRRVWSADEVRRRDRLAYQRLVRVAREISNRDRRYAKVIRECLSRQRKAIAELTGPIRPACWLVRRGGN